MFNFCSSDFTADCHCHTSMSLPVTDESDESETTLRHMVAIPVSVTIVSFVLLGASPKQLKSPARTQNSQVSLQRLASELVLRAPG